MRINLLLVAAATLAGMWIQAAQAEAAGVDASDRDLATVRERLLESRVHLSDADRKGVIAWADALLKSVRADGSWADQDYADRNRERWKCSDHLPRVVTLAKAARQPHLTPERQKAYLAAALNGLRFWLAADPTNTNWWHNEIGVPMHVGDILLMLGEDVPAELRQQGIELMRRSRWERWTGQNLVWGTKIQIMRSCISGDAKAAAEGFGRMYEEVRITPGQQDGMKADWSFFQHGPLLYSGGYGAGFSSDASRLAVLGAGTSLAIPQEKLELLVSYMLDGQAWTVRGRHWDYSVTGREIVRRGMNTGWLAVAAEDLASLDPARKSELRDMAARLREEAGVAPLTGNRHFWCADYMVHERPAWFTSVRMYSLRTFNTDGYINGENKQSHHLADGVTYIMLKGDEYEDIFPVWDWHKIPGATIEQGTVLEPAKVNRRGTERFVGGVSDGMYGCATMDLATGGLRASKSWFFFDEGFVALGAGITCPGGNDVVTTINQCLLRGEVRSGRDGTLARGTRHLGEADWVWHDQIGYVPLQAAKIRLSNDAQRGSWSEIGTGSSSPVARDVFSLAIEHGAGPADAGYAYLVLPAVSAEKTASAAGHLPVRILSNTSALQAVHHEGRDTTQAIFRKPGSVVAGRFQITVDHPCAVLVRPDGEQVHFAVANPGGEAGEVTLTITARLDAPGAQVLPDGSTRLKLTLPGGLDAGRSVTMTGHLFVK